MNKIRGKIQNKKQNQNNITTKKEPEKKIFNDTEKMLILRKVSRFLADKDKINIFKLNKKFTSKLNKKIYKEILNRKDEKVDKVEEHIKKRFILQKK